MTPNNAGCAINDLAEGDVAGAIENSGDALISGIFTQSSYKSAVQLKPASKIQQKPIHGNSLKCPRTNYGYKLVDKNTGQLIKYGETIHPKTRYTQKYLNENNFEIVIMRQGSKVDIHNWQHQQILDYKAANGGQRPPLNKNDW